MQGPVPYWGAGDVVDWVNRPLFDETLVLLGEDGAPFFDPTRDVSFVVDGPVWVNNHTHVLRPGPLVDPRFLSQALNSVDFSVYITGSTRDKLPQEDMNSIRVPLPSVEEQRRIADFLDDQVTRIDNIIAARQQQRGLLDAVQRASLDEFIRSADIPRTRLARFGFVQSGITVNSGRNASGGREVPYLRVANVQAGALDLAEVKSISATPDQLLRHSLRFGDVLMTEGGDLDKLGRGTVWREEIPGSIHQNHVFAVRVDSSRLVPEYLAYVTATSEARRYFESTGNRTTNLASTSATKVLDMPIPVRNIEEQRRVVATVAQVEEEIRGAAAMLGLSTDRLQELKRSLISAAVSGEFDVSTASGRGVPA